MRFAARVLLDGRTPRLDTMGTYRRPDNGRRVHDCAAVVAHVLEISSVPMLVKQLAALQRRARIKNSHLPRQTKNRKDNNYENVCANLGTGT